MNSHPARNPILVIQQVKPDAMHPPIRDTFAQKLRTHRQKASPQFLVVVKKKRPRISRMQKAIKQQLGHLERNLASIDSLIAWCGNLQAGSHSLITRGSGALGWD